VPEENRNRVLGVPNQGRNSKNIPAASRSGFVLIRNAIATTTTTAIQEQKIDLMILSLHKKFKSK
jgi:hypothetical protein